MKAPNDPAILLSCEQILFFSEILVFSTQRVQRDNKVVLLARTLEKRLNIEGLLLFISGCALLCGYP